MQSHPYTLIALIASLSFSSAFSEAADVLTPGFLKLSIYTNIAGTAVTALTADPNYPSAPGEVRFLRSFNTRDALPNDALETYGGRIEGFLTPQESGDYHFFLRSDDASELWLSSDATEGNATLIAEERDSGDPFLEPESGDPATSAPVALVAGQRYFIMVLYKSSALAGNSTDYAKVAWRKVGDTTPAAQLKPIPTAFLSTLASPAATAKVTITQQPSAVTGEENSRVTFTVAADVTPTNYVSIQWQRNGTNIVGATGTNYTRWLDKADNGAKFRAVVAVPGLSVTSAEANAAVTDDRTRPVLVSAKGGPNRPEVILTFSERVSASSATTLSNYRVTNPGGTALGLTGAALSADGTQVTLTNDTQVVGTEYTVTVNNVADLAATAPNTVAANSQAKFFALGPWLEGDDGFVVWEAEDYDRNLDGLWVPDTERGVASGGVSMVNNNGAGGGENNTKLEYDILFSRTGTHIIWWRFSGNDGNDDSAWIHLDGVRILGRETGNQSALSGTGTSLLGNWGWTANAAEGGGQLTFTIDAPGVHSIAITRREDGSFVDKFVITQDPGFNPTTGFGTFGPPVTRRQGEPPPASANFDFVTHPASTNALENTSVTLSATATIPPNVLFSYRWQRKEGTNFVDIPNSGGTTFTVNPLTMSWNGAVVRLRLIVSGVTKYSNEATITVIPETIAPGLVRATGSSLNSTAVLVFSEPVTPATAQNQASYKIDGPAGAVTVQAATLMANNRTVILNTGAQTVGAKYTVTVNGVNDTAATPNSVVNGQAKFYSMGQRLPQGADGLIVWEAEDFDRNLDDRWVTNSTRGTPSGGISVVIPVAGGTEAASKLEYDLTFTKTGTHIVWWRASSPDGNSDSSYFHLDGARPANRTTANQSSMSGFSGQPDFVWSGTPQEVGPRLNFDIATAGVHAIGLTWRETGAYFDKFAISSDTNFNVNLYGTFGPPETRAGIPPLPTISISSPVTNNTQFAFGTPIPISVRISPTTRTISKVEFLRDTVKIGESTTSPFSFTWLDAPVGTNNLTARLIDDVNDSLQTLVQTILVTQAQGISLTAAASANGLVLTWTGGAPPYTVQKKNLLSDANWVNVTTVDVTTATVPVQGASGFFRIATP